MRSEEKQSVDRLVKPRRFISMHYACDYVREKGQPEIIEIEGRGTIGVETWKLYPSGKAIQAVKFYSCVE